MLRTGVFVGVDQTGGLPKLGDAARGAARMHQWALSVGMADGTEAKLITDAGGVKVTPDIIYDAIKAIIDGPGADQLILYFAGHGVNINRSEHWLLTDAPTKTSAAVNVSGSVELARYCGIRHVVVISDACRVAPVGLQAQNVRGVDVFPSDGGGDRSKPVDQFFACLLGKTSAEFLDPATAAGSYTALYTTALLDALQCNSPILEGGETPVDASRYVRARRLASHLEVEVPRRVKALKLVGKINQNPDAIITSFGEWLARCDQPPPPPPAGAPVLYDREGSIGAEPRPRRSAARPREERLPSSKRTLRGVTKDLIRVAVDGNHAAVTNILTQARIEEVAGVEALAERTERIAAPFGPQHFETQCGVKVRGAKIVDAFMARALHLDVGAQEDIVRIKLPEIPASNVLLRFDEGAGAVIPVFPGFIAALSFEEGDLVDVAYEPSANTWLWDLYKSREADIRALRSIAAASSQNGRFRLDEVETFAIARRMQYAKGIDPTLAIYAAYAYHDLQEIDRIREMSNFLRNDLRATFFDLELLGRALHSRGVERGDNVVPFMPMLSQGWALLKANKVKMHPVLEGIEHSVRDSLWTLFDRGGFDRLLHAFRREELS